MIRIVVNLKIVPDRVRAFLALATTHAAASRREPGCVRFEVLRDAVRPYRFALHETFLDRAAVEAHRGTPHYAVWRAEIGPLQAEPRTHDEYRSVRAVLTNGCFDALHDGHLHLLREAARLGDVLIVAVNSDASVRRLKGLGRPIVSLTERIAALEAAPCVGRAITFDTETDLREIARSIEPEALVKGSDYRDMTLTGAEFARRLHFVERLPGFSTTALATHA